MKNPEPDDAANNTSKTDAALSSPTVTGAEVVEGDSLSRDEVASSMPVEEDVMSGSEEEKSKEIGNLNNVDVDKDKGAKTSKSSWRVMFHQKENVSTSSSSLVPEHCDAANDSQSETIKVSENVLQSEDEEKTVPVMENVTSGSEKLKAREIEMENEKKSEQSTSSEDKNSDEMQEGQKKEQNEANEQARVGDQIKENSKDETTTLEREERENIVESGSSSAGPTLEVKAESSGQKKMVLKKTEKPGMIFMCSKRTKQDCFDYKVFGLPAKSREVVHSISKGMRLFLFDTDLRVMYGIYKAVGPGGFNIEPKAFNSAFPSQVQYTVVKDCMPLAEEKFRVAIKDNYYRKNRFKFQLTTEQVKKLSELFVAASKGPNLSLKNDDVANESQENEYMSSRDMDIEESDMDVQEIICQVKQVTPIDKEMDPQIVKVCNKGKIATEKENEETMSEEEEKTVENLTVDYKTDELMCLEAGIKGEEEERAGDGGTGMIFMCNSKTKQDCIHYQVLGLPANKRETVQKVHKGMKLFMFDVDLRVMYGIYNAAEPGGYNIEPKAFNSRFPSQVRFTVLKDCVPLTEETFRVAIQENYYRKNKFNCQLTKEQVNKLCMLFVAAGRGHDSSMKGKAAEASQSKPTLSSQVDMYTEGSFVKPENPIEEAINEENNMKKAIKEKKDENFIVEHKTNEPMQEDGEDGESSGEEDEDEEKLGEISELKVGKKRKRGRNGNTGMIFMCNSKTKQDCFHYKVLGLPANKRETVEKIHKGMRLFLFDADLRLMYGIYKAAGHGGYNIEPRAFSSRFPSQVQYIVLRECLPLGEELFKAAIKDNYYTKWKFKFDLTAEQVKNLCKLFSSASKGQNTFKQPNLGYRHTHIQRGVVPMAQLPPIAAMPMHRSYGNANIYMGNPPFSPPGPRQDHSRYGP